MWRNVFHMYVQHVYTTGLKRRYIVSIVFGVNFYNDALLPITYL